MRSLIVAIAIRIIVFVILIALMNGCTEQDRARYFGGTSTVELEENKKLVNLTWKDGDLWILTKDMLPTDVAETYTFKEDSPYGVIEGLIIIKEKKIINSINSK